MMKHFEGLRNSTTGITRLLLVALIVLLQLGLQAEVADASDGSCDCAEAKQQVVELKRRVVEVRNGLEAVQRYIEASADQMLAGAELRSARDALRENERAIRNYEAHEKYLRDVEQELDYLTDFSNNPLGNPLHEVNLELLKRARNYMDARDFVMFNSNLYVASVNAVDYGSRALAIGILSFVHDSTNKALKSGRLYYDKALDKQEYLQADYEKESTEYSKHEDVVSNLLEKVREYTSEIISNSVVKAIQADLVEVEADLVKAETELEDCLQECEDCSNESEFKIHAGDPNCYKRFVPIVGWSSAPDPSILHESPEAACEYQRSHFEPDAVSLSPFPYEGYWSTWECDWSGGLILPSQTYAVCPDSPAWYFPTDHWYVSGPEEGPPMALMCESMYNDLAG